ncbi:unnamed protein product [Vitrella brassicaformis CCMP3155]|uniref:Acyltransferase n=2 Tax=Vitrella brassicaformis TaxID=1169539 RepID=A0A0G4E9J5_VITBC|nr:unnamed protein product [Vitrella brassicaformis CCMP3155]|eukprot:CEL92277.1 unnamed protein product [Vitrella brassicaformis CCMP3155]
MEDQDRREDAPEYTESSLSSPSSFFLGSDVSTSGSSNRLAALCRDFPDAKSAQQDDDSPRSTPDQLLPKRLRHRLARQLQANLAKLRWPSLTRRQRLFLTLAAVYIGWMWWTRRGPVKKGHWGPQWVAAAIAAAMGWGLKAAGCTWMGFGNLVPLDRGRGYILVVHPHGAYPVCVLHAGGRHARQNDPVNFFCGVFDPVFFMPVLREWFLLLCARSVDRKNLDGLLKAGKSFAIAPGGVYEQIRTDADQEQTFFPHNLGFIRLAAKYGVPLVPIYFFGQNQLLQTTEWSRWLAKWTYRHLGIPFQLTFGRFGLPWLPLPGFLFHQAKVYIKSGRPVEVGPPDASPSEEKVERIFNEYLTALQELFDHYKDECLPPAVAARGLKLVRRSAKHKKNKGDRRGRRGGEAPTKAKL